MSERVEFAGAVADYCALLGVTPWTGVIELPDTEYFTQRGYIERQFPKRDDEIQHAHAVARCLSFRDKAKKLAHVEIPASTPVAAPSAPPPLDQPPPVIQIHLATVVKCLKIIGWLLLLLCGLSVKQAFGQATDLLFFQNAAGTRLGLCIVCDIKEGANITITKSGNVYTFAAGAGGSTLWSAIGNPTANLSLTMGAFTSTFTYNATTGAGVTLMDLLDTLNNTGTGYIFRARTASGSAAKPFAATAGGTANGVEMSTAGSLGAIGSGGIVATTGDSATAFFSSGILESTIGGTANGFTKFSGPTASEKTFTLPDANATLVTTTRTLTGGAGIAAIGDLSADRTIATASGETDFLALGALVCGAATQGRIQVHTTPLQYCDNAATPALQYAAYGSSAGVATSATALAADPAACPANQFGNDTTTSAALVCAQPSFSNLSGTATDAQIPNNITIDLAASATALAANGANCSTGNYPLGVDTLGAVETCTASTNTKTHYIPLNCSTPRASTLAGNSFWTVGARTDMDMGHWEFVKDVDGKIYCSVLVPNTVAGTPAGAIVLRIAANAIAGVTTLQVGSLPVASGASLNGTLTDETVQDITVPGTAYLTGTVTFTLTTAPVAISQLFVEIFHDGDAVNDTLAVNTELYGAFLRVDLTE